VIDFDAVVDVVVDKVLVVVLEVDGDTEKDGVNVRVPLLVVEKEGVREELWVSLELKLCVVVKVPVLVTLSLCEVDMLAVPLKDGVSEKLGVALNDGVVLSLGDTLGLGLRVVVSLPVAVYDWEGVLLPERLGVLDVVSEVEPVELSDADVVPDTEGVLLALPDSLGEGVPETEAVVLDVKVRVPELDVVTLAVVLSVLDVVIVGDDDAVSDVLSVDVADTVADIEGLGLGDTSISWADVALPLSNGMLMLFAAFCMRAMDDTEMVDPFLKVGPMTQSMNSVALYAPKVVVTLEHIVVLEAERLSVEGFMKSVKSRVNRTVLPTNAVRSSCVLNALKGGRPNR
jgi:hypothetical protein